MFGLTLSNTLFMFCVFFTLSSFIIIVVEKRLKVRAIILLITALISGISLYHNSETRIYQLAEENRQIDVEVKKSLKNLEDSIDIRIKDRDFGKEFLIVKEENIQLTQSVIGFKEVIDKLMEGYKSFGERTVSAENKTIKMAKDLTQTLKDYKNLYERHVQLQDKVIKVLNHNKELIEREVQRQQIENETLELLNDFFRDLEKGLEEEFRKQQEQKKPEKEINI